MVPPSEGISDDPQAGDNPNPGIPPTQGVEDDTSNNDNEDADSPTNTIPRKGDGNVNTSNLNENVVVQ